MICAENLCRNYGEFAAVKNVSFTLNQGEVVGLLGHNGAGKTTIMKMLTGYLEPTAGRVLIDGKEVEADPVYIQSQLGYLAENLPVYPEMMVAEYLDYVAALRGIAESKRAEAVTRAISKTTLQSKVLAPISTLSRGYKQRLGVAQAIIHNPKILILDEPTNGLDPEQIQHMRELIKELSEETLVILSTHILQEVDAMCDRAIIIRGGEVVIDARLDELRSSSHIELMTNADADVIDSISAQISGIESWQQKPSDTNAFNSYQIKLKPTYVQTEVIANIAKEIVEQKYELIRLLNVQRDLETIFRQASLGHDRIEIVSSEEAGYV